MVDDTAESSSRRCSFCGRSAREVGGMIDSSTAMICHGCAELCHEAVVERRGEASAQPLGEPPRPHDIKAFLDTYVVGRERAKQALSVAVFSHYKRVRVNASSRRPSDAEPTKSNVLPLGPTGSGKTPLVQSPARTLNVPNRPMGRRTCRTGTEPAIRCQQGSTLASADD
ncbi:ClpX C4-type zinc finger protein [Streptosporangium sp. NPDC020072]|uniref:ClpX C4-type zinc finger protein n=1 Tax=Streptosporangium sp. NPDC020072 TaxID=3154788 RepID=UPI00343F295A